MSELSEQQSNNASVASDLSDILHQMPSDVMSVINVVQQAGNEIAITVVSPKDQSSTWLKISPSKNRLKTDDTGIYGCSINSKAFIGVIFLNKVIIDALSDVLLPGWNFEKSELFSINLRTNYIIKYFMKGIGFQGKSANDLNTNFFYSIPIKYNYSQFQLVAQFGEVSVPIIVGIDSANVDYFKKFLGSIASPRLIWDMPLKTNFDLSRTILKREFDQLGIDDVIIFTLAHNDLIVITGDIGAVLSLQAQLDLSDKPTITIMQLQWVQENIAGQKFQKIKFNVEDRAMNNESEEVIDDDQGISTENSISDNLILETLRDIPINVSISFTDTSITFERASSLAVGSVLETNLNLQDPVNISANGTIVGKGYLIKVGNSVGVQIASWNVKKLSSNVQ